MKIYCEKKSPLFMASFPPSPPPLLVLHNCAREKSVSLCKQQVFSHALLAFSTFPQFKCICNHFYKYDY